MKIKFQYILILAVVLAFVSCEKDNYDAPGSSLKGRLVYHGEPINVEYNQVNLELWQPGFGKNGSIDVTVAQDGSYSSLLFNGNYKMVIRPGQGPFLWKQNAQGAPDTIAISVNGNQNLDVEVTPYFMVRTPQFSAASETVTANFKIEKIVTDVNAKDVEKVTLYVNKTQFVSGANNIASSELAISPATDWNSLNLSVAIPAMKPTQNYVFARIGVKIAGVEDLIFSPVQKVQL
jgi:hypothetical protein